MQNRIRPADDMSVTNKNEADNLLAELGKLMRERSRIDSLLQNRIDKAKMEFKERAHPVDVEIKHIENALEVFVRNIIPGMKGKSLKLNHGVIGVRKSSQLKLPRNAVERLENLGRDDLLRVKKSADKEKIRQETPEFIKTIGGKIEEKDEFYIEMPKGLVETVEDVKQAS